MAPPCRGLSLAVGSGRDGKKSAQTGNVIGHRLDLLVIELGRHLGHRQGGGAAPPPGHSSHPPPLLLPRGPAPGGGGGAGPRWRKRFNCATVYSACWPDRRGYCAGMPAPFGLWQPAQAAIWRSAMPPREMRSPRAIRSLSLAKPALAGWVVSQ